MAGRRAATQLAASRWAAATRLAGPSSGIQQFGFLDKLQRWADCIKVAPPRQRNHTEIEQAYEDFKLRFDNFK